MGSKTKLQIRADLRLDLKDSGALWSDAELNRSIERSVADFNRFLPDEKIYEDSLQFAVTGEEVVFPKAANAAAVVNAQSIDVAAGGLLTISGQPDVPRTLIVTIVDADDSTYGATFIIRGSDKDEQYQEEIFHFTRGDSKIIPGKKVFKNVYEVELNQDYGSHALDTASVGYGLYTDTWVYLANSPIKWQSESATNDDDSDAAVVRNTDFYIDYANGRVKAIADEGISAENTCTFAYKKSQIGIDLSGLAGLIRVHKVEYPIGQIPQNFVQGDTFGKYYVVTGMGESEEQRQMAEGQQFRIYYDAQHHQPGEMSPGTIPEFLESTVETMAGAYALYTYALKQEHQAAADMVLAGTALGNATGSHSALAIALTNLKKYLDNNTTNDAESSLGSANGDHSAFALVIADMEKYLDDNSGYEAATILSHVETDVANLRTAIFAAGTAMNSYLDNVNIHITMADDQRAKYMGATANYVNGDTEPDILAYLKAGDALLNKVAVGGEGQDVARAYREYAQTVKDSLVAAFENDIAFYLQKCTQETNAAMVYAQEMAQRISNIRSYIEQSAGYVAISGMFGREAELRVASIGTYLRQAEGYVAIANTFAREAEDRLVQIRSYIEQANSYATAAGSSVALADRFRAEADERRNEVYSIWRDRKQYIGDFTAGSMRQMPSYD